MPVQQNLVVAFFSTVGAQDGFSSVRPTINEVQEGLEGPMVTLLGAVVLTHLCSCGGFGLHTHGPAAFGSVGCLSVIGHILENLSSVGVQKEGGPHMVGHVCSSSMAGG